MAELFLQGKASRSEAAVAVVVAGQYGVLSRAQALDAGFSDKMIWARHRSGAWVRVHAGVYRVAAVPDSWRARLMAACLALDAGAVVSHRAAAALWGLDGFEEGPVEVTVPGTGQRRLGGVTVHRTRSLPVADRAEREGLPVTRPARTLIDLAGVVEEEALESAVDTVLREGLASISYVRRRMAALGTRGRAGVPLLQDVLADRVGGRPAESPRENRLVRELRAAGLPKPVRQYELRDEGGELVARFDLAYPNQRIGIEYDSYRHHHGRQAWRKDRARHNRSTALGWLVFHVVDSRDVTAVARAYAA